MHGLFITGTDTGVGKTYVGTWLAKLLVARGRRVRPRKPVESGCPQVDGMLQPEDAAAYRLAVGAAEPLERICRHRFGAALSPARAALLAGQDLRLADLLAACLDGVEAEDFLLVEGAGGFCSPIATDGLNADLAVALGLPVLLVSADRLGAIHQVLVTAEAITRRGLKLAGVVLNRLTPTLDPQLDNAADLRHWLCGEIVTLDYGGGGEAGCGAEKSLARLIDPMRPAAGDAGA